MSPLGKTSPPKWIEAQPKVLIIGAGVTGLVLGQVFKKNDIAFSIFERDPSVSIRGQGWGLTIHWALDTLIDLLPQHIIDRLPEAYVDPESSKKGENGNFLFFDLRSGETRWKVPPNKRIRVSRERLRALLLEGLDVQVSRFVHLSGRFLIDDSGPKPSPHSPQMTQKLQSQPTSPTPLRTQARFSWEPTASTPAFALLFLAMSPTLRSIKNCPSASSASASSIRSTLR